MGRTLVGNRAALPDTGVPHLGMKPSSGDTAPREAFGSVSGSRHRGFGVSQNFSAEPLALAKGVTRSLSRAPSAGHSHACWKSGSSMGGCGRTATAAGGFPGCHGRGTRERQVVGERMVLCPPRRGVLGRSAPPVSPALMFYPHLKHLIQVAADYQVCW